MDPSHKEICCPDIIEAFRHIGLSDYIRTGIHAIFQNWYGLGRTPKQILIYKARKQFEMLLITKPLITAVMEGFRKTIAIPSTSNITVQVTGEVLSLQHKQFDWSMWFAYRKSPVDATMDQNQPALPSWDFLSGQRF